MKYQREFQGCHAPPTLFDLVDTGVLTTTEAWLWLNINSFQQHGKDCFMSNVGLGKCIGVQKRQTQVLIAHLEELNLVWKSEKIIDGELTRVLTCRYPDQTPSAIQCAPPRKKMHLQGRSEMRPKEEKNTEEILSHPASAGNGTAIVEDLRWEKMATHLAIAVKAATKLDRIGRVKQWAKSFELLHRVDKVDRIRIKRALQWYCKHLPIRYGEKFFPVALSGDSFRNKFMDGKIEGVIKRVKALEEGEDGGDANNGDSGEPGEQVTVETVVRDKPMTPAEYEKFREEFT